MTVCLLEVWHPMDQSLTTPQLSYRFLPWLKGSSFSDYMWSFWLTAKGIALFYCHYNFNPPWRGWLLRFVVWQPVHEVEHLAVTQVMRTSNPHRWFFCKSIKRHGFPKYEPSLLSDSQWDQWLVKYEYCVIKLNCFCLLSLGFFVFISIC